MFYSARSFYHSFIIRITSDRVDKTKVSKTNGSLIKVESIAECSLGTFCNTFDLHSAIIGLENHFFGLPFDWPL